MMADAAATLPIPTSEIQHTISGYECPECGAHYPGKFAVGQHRAVQHGIPNDWVKRPRAQPSGKPARRAAASTPPASRASKKKKAKSKILAKANGQERIDTRAVRFLHGGYKCPECGKKFIKRLSLGTHRATAHGIQGQSAASVDRRRRLAEQSEIKTNSRGVILTASVPKLDGRYACPECGAKYGRKTALGGHRRFTHGIMGEYHAKHARQVERRHEATRPVGRPRKTQSRTNGVDHESGAAGAIEILSAADATEAAQPQLAQRRSRKAQWSEESLTGFIFAHVHTLIENACRGREDAIPNITQRLSELLSLEILGQTQRSKNLGLLRGMP